MARAPPPAGAREVEEQADERAALLERQERFLHDVSHELRTPVTIARGHLEVLRRGHAASPELDVALDELGGSSGSSSGCCCSPRPTSRTSSCSAEIELEPFLEDVFIRWSEVAPRAWRLGPSPPGSLRADAEALRIALDALLENAVKHTEPRGRDRDPGAGRRRRRS